MYGEDIDLSYRIVQAGYKNLYYPERLLHYKGESAKQDDRRYIEAFYGAMLIFYQKYYPNSSGLLRGLIRLAVRLKALTASGASKQKKKGLPHHRLLVISEADHFEQVKMACGEAMPTLERANLWDLDEERVMNAICRRNQMKGFTDYVFCYPDVRFEQMLLFMDTLKSHRVSYHIFNTKSGRLVSAGQL